MPRGGDHTREHTLLVSQIRAAINATGRANVWLVRPGFSRCRCLGLGAADLVGVLAPNGRFFAIEVKTGEGELSDEQECWHRAVSDAGGACWVVRSVDDAMKRLESIQ